MKKIICLLLSTVLLFGLCACNSNDATSKPEGSNQTTADNASTTTATNSKTENTTQPSEEDKNAKIEACKEYLNSIKVYVGDYSVFDFAPNEQKEYISFTPDAYPSEKACSALIIIDYGDRALKREYTPYFQIVVPNESKGIDDGVKHDCINTSWLLDDQIGINLHRLNREVPLKDISYKITVSELDIVVEGDLPDTANFDEALSVISKHSDGAPSTHKINGRIYKLIAGKRTENTIYHIEGTNKYFVEKEYIYIPMSGGAEVTLTPADFKYEAPDGLPTRISFGTRINHTNHSGYGNLQYDIVVGFCCIVELSPDEAAIVDKYHNGDYEQYRDAYSDLFYEMEEYFDNVKVIVKNDGQTSVLHELDSSY